MSQYGETTSRDDATSGTRLKKAQSLLRVIREHQEIQQNINPYWCAAPVNEDDPYEWHFTIRGPMNSEFEGGLYHGRILLPSNYPLTPPSVILLTKNGRFVIPTCMRCVCICTRSSNMVQKNVVLLVSKCFYLFI